MIIEFSRHAKRRMQLYKIEKKDVIDMVESYLVNTATIAERQEIVEKALPSKNRYPLKVVFSLKDDKIVIITAYPLKRELRV